MPRTGVSYDDVKSAIQTLENAGLNPSIRMVREKLGRGSLTTIAGHKRAYEAESAKGPTEALPDPIARALINGAQEYWQELVEAAEAEIAAAREVADGELNVLNVRLEKVEHETTALKDALGSKVSAIDVLEKAAKEQMTTCEKQSKALQVRDVELARLQTKLKTLRTQHDDVGVEFRTATGALSDAKSEFARLTERLERQAAEFAKERSTLQKHFNEYKDRLVTMSDDNHQANSARRKSEKAAFTSEKKASEIERENQRLCRELIDEKDEARGLTEKLGELHGRLSAKDERLADSRKGFELLLSEKDERAKGLSVALTEAQSLVRQFVPKGTDLAQELIDERKSAG